MTNSSEVAQHYHWASCSNVSQMAAPCSNWPRQLPSTHWLR